jgi:anti-sigma-K factor RskA
VNQDRLLELLADRATQGLSADERRELERLIAENPGINPEVLELTAAALANATAGPVEPVPAGLRATLAAAAEQWIGQDTSVVAKIQPHAQRPKTAVWSGWLVAAACLALAAVAWWPRLPKPDMAAQRLAMMGQPRSTTMPLAPFVMGDAHEPPEVLGVTGDVVWNESAQRGFIRLAGLPPKDPAKEQYQIWLVDDRGMNFRINGGVFDSTSAQEMIVPITPDLHTRGVKAVAVTIEPPGGVVVSDMKRRVVIATGG